LSENNNKNFRVGKEIGNTTFIFLGLTLLSLKNVCNYDIMILDIK